MTIQQYDIVRIAKAIEYYDQFIPCVGEYDEKAKEAEKIQKILTDGILASYPENYDAEKVNKALEIVRSIA